MPIGFAGEIMGTRKMTVKGSCYCGATQFTVPKRPDTVTRCTCSFSFYTKRGALRAYQD